MEDASLLLADNSKTEETVETQMQGSPRPSECAQKLPSFLTLVWRGSLSSAWDSNMDDDIIDTKHFLFPSLIFPSLKLLFHEAFQTNGFHSCY